MNKNLIGGLSAVVVCIAVGIGSFIWNNKGDAHQTQGFNPTGNLVGVGYPTSGKTPQEVIAAEVRQGSEGLERTMTVHSGILAKGGQLAILNNVHYKDTGCVSTVIHPGALPVGGIDAIKGKTLTFCGQLGEYKGKPQFLATKVKQ